MGYPNKQSPEQWAAQLDFAGLEKQHGLPAGVLTKLVRQESGGNCSATSPRGAHGLCQFMPATAKEFGVDSSDPKSSANGAARYLEQLMDMFDGDPAKAIAAYNWGPGNMRKNLRNHPNDWRAHLPPETTHYLSVVGSGIGESFVQRQARGALTQEDRDVEAERRRKELQEAGLSTTMSTDSLLGSLFFMLIKSFLENKFDGLEKNGQERGPSVVPPESVSLADRQTPARTPLLTTTTHAPARA